MNGPRKHTSIEAVVVGASAGGVEALLALLPHLPADFTPAVLIVLHLPRQFPSALVEICTPRCALPVREAEDKTAIVGGTVYFAPPDYHLLVDRGPTLALSTDHPVNYSRPSIDVLFESAADRYRERLAGVVLTGANADGAAGLAAVAAAGGLTIVQQPTEASASAMPAAALERVRADHVLALADIGRLLQTLSSGHGTSA